MKSTYIKSALLANQLPPCDAPEIAFLGRSNCGKSSLINTLLERTNLARASRTPGRTQMINFFSVETKDTHLLLADLPGYGFSATGRETRKHWQDLILTYLNRPCLEQLFLLLDARRVQDLNEEDIAVAALTSRPERIHVVFTKIDKLKQSELMSLKRKTPEALQTLRLPPSTKVSYVSNTKKTGLVELRQNLMSFLKERSPQDV